MKRKKLIYGVAVIVAIALWAGFRPERLFVNARVNEAMPAGLSNISQTVLSSGSFHSVAHESRGTASIYQLADGRRILRLTNFETSNGPDVHVYLIAANDASDSATVKKAGFLELGSLKGNIGDQNYDLPTDADLAKYRAVTIWCKRFSVNFGTAPLNSSAAAPGIGQVLASGNFHDVAHKGVGQATIYQLGGGQRVLRFTNFETSNGPDVRVYLIATKDASDSETVRRSGFVEVGALKGNIGDQNYEISSDLDLNKYRAVTIWCKRFGVNFATAPLTAAGTAMSAKNR
ncbi:MAG TPA: DM13 domain-containing protein [Candidatus Acidoferrum sp.]